MTIHAISTTLFQKNQNLAGFILRHAGQIIKEKSILCVTSKIVSLSEGRTVCSQNQDKKALIKKESEVYIGEIGYGTHLTIKEGQLIPSAGIDKSNSPEGDYILYPKKPFKTAETLRKTLQKKLSLKKMGLIITDSRTLPLRTGTVGLALSYSGFKGVKNMIGKQDLFGRPLKMTRINLVDSLAISAVMLMGEGAESCPLAIIHKAPVVFTQKTNFREIKIPLKEDLYYPLFSPYIKSSSKTREKK